MKRKTTKTIAWLLLAVCLFMAGRALSTTVEDTYKDDIDPECLMISNYVDSNECNNLAYNIMDELMNGLVDENYKLNFPLAKDTLHYYASNGDKVITNSKGMDRKDYEGQKYMFVQDVDTSGNIKNQSATIGWNGFGFGEELKSKTSIYFAISEDTIDSLQADWEKDRGTLLNDLAILAFFGIMSLAITIFLFVVAGRKPEDKELHLMRVDGWYTEIFLGLLIGIWMLSGALIAGGADVVYSDSWQSLSMAAKGSLLALLAGTVLLSTMFLLPIVRKAKAKTFFKSSLIFRLLRWCWIILKKIVLGIKSFFDGSAYKEHLLTKRLFRSQMVYICGSAGLLLFCVILSAASYSSFPVFLFIVLELLITTWYVSGNKKAYSEINAGYVESLKEQTKSENTKTALITNVSHDLKTPLTSIITYVDLLSKEEDLSETSRDYVNIIAGKAERLKHIVSDLFDLSKSVSGNIPLEMDVLDLRTLMEQTLADMKDPIESSGHTLRTNLGQEPATIFSDGKKLYRVFQNIIDNALKYSLTGSRIFIDLVSKGNAVKVTVKNTAGYEMNFSEEEILQRFTRGDQSRTGEGSGLGLSIAESFTQSCGGTFDLDIDGDQFKVSVEFRTVEVTGRTV